MGGEKYYTAGAVQTAAQDWNATLIRAAMGVDEEGGYLEDPTGNLSKVRTVVDAAIANDLYVIIDWHSHHAEDYTQSAVDFFQQMASEYGQHNHVIYEIYNEPLSVSWSGTIKPYAEEVISAIRAIDPDNLIVVGTPTWSQDVDAAANDPITSHDNIAYTLHFYAGTHTQYLRDKAQYALDRGIPLFATEWGTVNADGDGSVARSETDTWMNFFKQNNISHANWALNDKDEGASALVAGASPNGGWSDGEYTDSGHYVREIIRNWGGDGQVDPDPGGCDASNVVSNGATVTVSQGQCVGYQHGSGQLRLGSWDVSEGARYDITDCNGNTTTDVAQVVNAFTAVPTDTANCTHTIYVRQAPHSYSLQFGSW